MADVKEDRRIRRTKKLLREGLAELMQEKDFKDITVKDITERADLNRGTFYLHYCDTYDLLEKMENEIIQNFEDMLNNYSRKNDSTSAYLIVDQIFIYITENLEICKTLIQNKSGDAFIKKFISVLGKKGFSIIKGYNKNCTEDEFEYTFNYIAWGIIGVLRNWFDNNMVPERSKITKIIDNLITSNLNSLH